MKTYKNLYPRIWAYQNLHTAWRNAARRKRESAGVASFEYALTDNLLQLEDELQTQTYRPGAYTSFRITSPKPRVISAAPFRDRVVHHALVQQIEPIFEARFSRDSYACRVGKGTHAALHRCQEFARRYPYVLQCDVVQFFPALDHALLRNILFRTIADEQTRWLIDQILARPTPAIACSSVAMALRSPAAFGNNCASSPLAHWTMPISPRRCAAGSRTLPMVTPTACGGRWSRNTSFPEGQRGTIAHLRTDL